MASIHKEVSIDAPADHVWDALQDVGAIHTRLATGFVVDTQLEATPGWLRSPAASWPASGLSTSTIARGGSRTPSSKDGRPTITHRFRPSPTAPPGRASSGLRICCPTTWPDRWAA